MAWSGVVGGNANANAGSRRDGEGIQVLGVMERECGFWERWRGNADSRRDGEGIQVLGVMEREYRFWE